MPKVSVIIPIYNVEKYLRECLNSIVVQTLKNIEIICVDDASPDNSAKILSEFASKDKRIKIIKHKKNQGLGPARNTGITYALSPYISFIDSDDFVAPTMLESLYNALRNEKADLAIIGNATVTESGVLIGYRVIPEGNWEVSTLLNSDRFYPAILPMWNKMFHRDLIKDIKQLPIISEDLPAIAEYLIRAKRIVTINKPLYFYRKRIGTLSNPSNQPLKQWDDFFYSNKLFLNILREKYSFITLKKLTILRASAIFWRIHNQNLLTSSTWRQQEKKIILYLKKDILLIKNTSYGLYLYLKILFSLRLPKSIINRLVHLGLYLSLNTWIHNKNLLGCFFDTTKYLISISKSFIKTILGKIEVRTFRLASIVFKYLNRKPIWLIGERPNTAQENGLYFFKYLISNHPNINALYIINKQSYAYKTLSKKRIVNYNSVKHKLLFFACKYYVSSHYNHCYPNTQFSKRRYVLSERSSNVFLQHGITYADVSPFYGKKETQISLFICGAKPEFDFINEKFGYNPKEVVYTGFARFDGLHNYKTKKQILLMPTWRREISTNNNIDYFLSSSYYRIFQRLINNMELGRMLEDYGYDMVFSPHYEIHPYINYFSSPIDNIFVASDTELIVQDLLKESALLITDTSSVQFDFAYMFKPIIYYCFDKELFALTHFRPGYFDQNKMGFGEVIYNEDLLVHTIEEFLKNDCRMDAIYRNRAKNFFPLHDTNNCSRIFNEIAK